MGYNKLTAINFFTVSTLALVTISCHQRERILRCSSGLGLARLTGKSFFGSSYHIKISRTILVGGDIRWCPMLRIANDNMTVSTPKYHPKQGLQIELWCAWESTVCHDLKPTAEYATLA